VNSIDDYLATFGARVSQGLVYDALDVFFQEGGSRRSSPVSSGPSPVYATVNLLDGSSVISLVATAKTTAPTRTATRSSSRRFRPVHDPGAGRELERPRDERLPHDAGRRCRVRRREPVHQHRARGQLELIPVAATRTLASGTDDYASATDTQWLAALNLFTKDLGPGQVAMPGRSTATAHANLVGHAAAYNRRALLDFADTGEPRHARHRRRHRHRALEQPVRRRLRPLGDRPGVLNNTTRTVPFSAVAAGIIARNDQAGVTPNQPSAGVQYGVSRYILGLSQAAWSDADRELLNNAGVNVAMNINGQPTIFGYRSLAPSTVPADWLLFSNSRLVMAIVAQAQAIGQRYVFRQIDGRGLLFADFQADLVGMLKPYFNDGSLFGDTPQDAFSVDVGPTVNTATTLSQLKLIAVISLQLSPDAEQVRSRSSPRPSRKG
jgi:hypothetical protein